MKLAIRQWSMNPPAESDLISEKTGSENSYSPLLQPFLWFLSFLFVLIFHLPRIFNPTILGDDVIRIVDAKTLPLITQMFRPFSEHIAPGFELITALLVRSFPNDLALISSSLTITAFLAWLTFLISVCLWTWTLTRNHDTARLSCVLVGLSSACIEIPWWFSAATYSLSAAAIFLVLSLLNCSQQKFHFRTCLIIAMLTALSMSFSSLGLIGPVIGGYIIVCRSGALRSKIMKISAILCGLAVYGLICLVFDQSLIHAAAKNNREMTDILHGIRYAISVPGGVGLPLFLGIDARYITSQFHWLWALPATLSVVLAIFIGLRRDKYWPDMIGLLLLPYLVIYPTRAGLVISSRWQEPDFLYFWASRYHLFAIVSLSTTFSVVVIRLLNSSLTPRIRTAIILIVMSIAGYLQTGNLSHWSWMYNQPDQLATLRSLNLLQKEAGQARISQEQLLDLFPPVRRGWNASVLELRPDTFPLVRLIANRGDLYKGSVTQRLNQSLKIQEIHHQLKFNLGVENWRNLRSDTFLNLCPQNPDPDTTIVIQTDPHAEKAERRSELEWNITDWGGSLIFEMEIPDFQSGIFLKHLNSPGPVVLQWSFENEIWDDRLQGWYEPTVAENRSVPDWISLTPQDLDISPDSTWPVKLQLRIRPVMPGILNYQEIVVGHPLQTSP